MRFHNHYELEGKHAFLGASQYSWIRYTKERVRELVHTRAQAALGASLHAYANDAIRLRIKQVKNGKTLNDYINDAIGFRMSTEVVLFATDNAFGTADTICFRDNFLRIHDLKSGLTKSSFDQLFIYAAYCCIEYNIDPKKIQIELRIYQNDEILIMNTEDEFSPILENVLNIIEIVREFDEIINKEREDLYP